ncbi:MAG TPA: Lrp/AsnC ligand binding domain-containing protein [Thermoplasmata archaeon]|nr:Lrp/AsnC ligand binding domain-containing protein [Thermoplasmata archaeon]
MADDDRTLALYVKSKRAVTSFYHAPSSTPYAHDAPTSNVPGPYPTTAGPAGAEYDTRADEPVHFLSDDQARCVALVEELAARRGYTTHVVDIEKVGRVERLIAEHLRGVQHFPVLISPKGGRLEGCDAFTEENLAALMPTELKGVRAFSYIKVRGGDLDRIRHLLENLNEVKELHFLTGDWDVVVVLDFAPGAGGKRTVLDFVTERIRGIPEVLDTSTVVPEFSVTKFPLP